MIPTTESALAGLNFGKFQKSVQDEALLSAAEKHVQIAKKEELDSQMIRKNTTQTDPSSVHCDMRTVISGLLSMAYTCLKPEI